MIQKQCKNNRNEQALTLAFVTLISLGTGTDLAAFEAIITNERSGDAIHINDEGSTTHVAKVCSRPRGMTKGFDDSQVVIACSDDDKVIIYNRKTKAIEAEINNVTGAMNLTFHEPTGQLLVTNEGSSRASVYDLKSGRFIAELRTGLEPDGIAITGDGKLIFVASENAGLVHVFDGATYQPLDVIRTNLRPRRIALSSDELWVSSEMGSRVEIFDTKTRKMKAEVIFAPKGFRPEQMTPVDILFNPNNNEAYVALGGANHVAIVDTKTLKITKYILVGRRAWGLGLSPDAQTLIVLNGLSDDFTMINLNTRRPTLTRRAGLIPHSIEVFK